MKFTTPAKAFFVFLLFVVIFFIGLNLGRSVERANSTFVPPTSTPSPTQPLPTVAPEIVAYETFAFDECGVSFLVPSTFSDISDVKNEAELVSGSDRIFVTCDQSVIANSEHAENFESSASATLANQDTVLYIENGSYVWTLRNSARQQVLFDIPQSLAPLIHQTLEL